MADAKDAGRCFYLKTTIQTLQHVEPGRLYWIHLKQKKDKYMFMGTVLTPELPWPVLTTECPSPNPSCLLLGPGGRHVLGPLRARAALLQATYLLPPSLHRASS